MSKTKSSIYKNREIQYQFQSMFLSLSSFQRQFDQIDSIFLTLKIPDILTSKCIFYQDFLSSKLMELNRKISTLQINFLDELCLEVTNHFESKLAKSKVLEECERVMDEEFQEKTNIFEKLRRKIVPVQVKNKTLKMIELFTTKVFRYPLPGFYEEVSKWQLHKKKMVLRAKKKEMTKIQKLYNIKLNRDPTSQIDTLRRYLKFKPKEIYFERKRENFLVSKFYY